jgi:hypothetical protein
MGLPGGPDPQNTRFPDPDREPSKDMRNFLCPRYDQCLGRAAASDQFFDCDDCAESESVVGQFDYDGDFDGCVRLLRAVFDIPDPYEETRDC